VWEWGVANRAYKLANAGYKVRARASYKVRANTGYKVNARAG
jgi:hypothetical protein